MGIDFDRIRKVLIEDWDPIGIKYLVGFDGPADTEYNGYAREIHSKLSQGTTLSEIRDYLRWAEEHMGIDIDPYRVSAVAKKLVALR